MRALAYLQRHPQTGVYRVRRRIPKSLQSLFDGRCEFIKSLETRNIGQAKSRALPIIAEIQQRFDKAANASQASDIDGPISNNLIDDSAQSSAQSDLGCGGSEDVCPDEVNIIAFKSPSLAMNLIKSSDEKTLSELCDALLKAREYKPKTVPDVRRSLIY